MFFLCRFAGPSTFYPIPFFGLRLAYIPVKDHPQAKCKWLSAFIFSRVDIVVQLLLYLRIAHNKISFNKFNKNHQSNRNPLMFICRNAPGGNIC
jgi:hypothetical protein